MNLTNNLNELTTKIEQWAVDKKLDEALPEDYGESAKKDKPQEQAHTA